MIHATRRVRFPHPKSQSSTELNNKNIYRTTELNNKDIYVRTTELNNKNIYRTTELNNKDIYVRTTELNNKNIYVLQIGASLCYKLGELCFITN